jgi:hypothetical protein
MDVFGLKSSLAGSGAQTRDPLMQGERLLPSFAHRNGLLEYPVKQTARVPVLWSCTCPGNYANSAPRLDLSFQCCHKSVHWDNKSQPCEAELSWRRICLCPEICDAVHARHSFRTSMTEIALQCHAAGYAPVGTRQSHNEEQRGLMAFLLDPGSMYTANCHVMCTQHS